jgi:DNA-binding CsgD family transcriptional regulator
MDAVIICKMPNKYQESIKPGGVIVCQFPGPEDRCDKCFLFSQMFDTAVGIALNNKINHTQGLYGRDLSTREIQVVKCVAEGNPNKEIADKMGISETTVKAHMRTIINKLGVKNRSQAVAKALEQGVIKT